MSRLHFLGDWGWLPAWSLAILLAAAAWLLYHKSLRGRHGPAAVLLPSLRALAVLLVVLMLAGPTLRHRYRTGNLARLDIVLDVSESMDFADPYLEPGRKLLLARELGWLDPEASIDFAFPSAALALADARRAAVSPVPPEEAAEAFALAATQAQKALKSASPTSWHFLSQRGALLYERWDNVQGSKVQDLLEHEAFPEEPTRSASVKRFESIANTGDNFGDRLRGYLIPPETGEHVFWISGDDASELRLSPDEEAGRARTIASVQFSTGRDVWNKEATQQSEPIHLKAGKPYYVEAIHKEGSGIDFVSVGWRRPGGATERPIPGAYLAAPVVIGSETVGPLEEYDVLRRTLIEPAQRVAAQADHGALPVTSALQDLSRVAAAWEIQLHKAFDLMAGQMEDSIMDVVNERFGRATRRERLSSILLAGEHPLLDRLAEEYDAACFALVNQKLIPLWDSRAGWMNKQRALPMAVDLDTRGDRSDLDAALAPVFEATEKEMGGTDVPQRALLLFSDGAHNSGPSPLRRAAILGARGVSVFTIGMGATKETGDLAVADVEAPTSVFYKDQVRGRIIVKDAMAPGESFEAIIRFREKVVWRMALETSGTRWHPVPFEFPLQGIVEQLEHTDAEGVERAGVALTFEVELAVPSTDREAGNNTSSMSLFAALHKHRVLIVDGRPRWEWRYVHNLFKRDPKWEANGVLVERGALPRGDGEGAFPDRRDKLFAYDLVVLGDVPVSSWHEGELQDLADFVSDRGGGLIIIDGARGHLGGYAGTPIEHLLPVHRLHNNGPSTGPYTWSVTQEGIEQPVLEITELETRPSTYGWSELRPPRNVQPVEALPGSTVWVEAETGTTNVPVIVTRRFGAGKVLYHAFDETWRWRHQVADLYHQRYWNQAALWAMEAPYAVHNRNLSLDTDTYTYRPGQRAELRARIFDDRGQVLRPAEAQAVLTRNGEVFAQVPLVSDRHEGGIHRGLSPPLPEGYYGVRVQGEGLPKAVADVEVSFAVQNPPSRERIDLACNEELLSEMARVSRGAYLREEDASRMVDLLRPLSEGKVVEKETALWQSYWWFTAIMALLAAEWIIRKREGLL